jgi:hypothetical protein
MIRDESFRPSCILLEMGFRWSISLISNQWATDIVSVELFILPLVLGFVQLDDPL